ncbi:hypothetical protein RchiOBHm_Chr4g0410331 [Rosa chinensis]|uniref:Uncharacterized protein n=1 Tax=Rosa chinensis TaxID=74649 RepID=A0A2P6QVB9_ROSCH|nr:hypothetical protein RchiOBHm_Chr4g0410331 [Rosa chinensis]
MRSILGYDVPTNLQPWRGGESTISLMSSRALGFLRERQRISILGKDLGQSLMLYRSLR